jgi:glycosyltransferase involved in cell wall biosynthesis
MVRSDTPREMSAPNIGLVAVGGRGWMGGANYVRHLAAAIRAAKPDASVSYLCGDTISEDWIDAQPRIDVPVKRNRWQRWLHIKSPPLRPILERAGIEFVYPITYDNRYNLGLEFPASDKLNGVRWAGWIPDFQHEHLPGFFTADDIEFRRRSITELTAEAATLVFSSQSSLADFRQFYPDFRGRTEVLRFAVTPFDLPSDDAAVLGNVPPRYFLVCNQFWRHKNHAIVFEALRILKDRGVNPSVLCTGLLHDYRNAAVAQEIETQLRDYDLASQVVLLGLVSRERQLAVMRRALAVIQPSLFEGWSTVVEDIRALGRPSFLSNLDVHVEQNPPAAKFFPPHDAEALANLMAEAWTGYPPGPDREAEEGAMRSTRDRLVAIGHEVLTIASHGS